MKVTKLDNKKLNEEELRSNQNLHKPEDVHIHADIPYGVARDEDTAAQEHAEEVYDALEKDASSVTPKDPDTGKVKIPKNMYAEKIALDESLFTEDADTDKGEVATFLKDSVEWLIDEQMGCSTYKLDDRLGICVGWESGFDANDEDVIHSNDEPTWAIVAGIKVYTSDDMRTDYDWISYPYFANGDTVDTSVSVSPNENYDELANYFIGEFEGMKDWEIEEDGLVIKSDIGDEDAEVEEALNEAIQLNFDKALLDKWIDALNGKKENKDIHKTYFYTMGNKYIKVSSTYGGKYDEAVFAFVDADGNIYKPDGWRTPAKGIRARIDKNPPMDDGALYSSRYYGGNASGKAESLSPKHRRKVNEAKKHNLEPRKRTAPDGKVWWVAYDTDSKKYSTITTIGKYENKKDCQYAIDKYNKLNESKSLKEGASNFWSMDKFPLLVFMDYDSVYDRAFDDTIKELGYPDIEMDEEITDTPEFEKNFEIESQGVATLAEWDLGELEEVIGDFNDKLKNEYYENHAEYWDGADDARVELKDGYYEGGQIYVPDERYLADWQVDMINNFLETLKEKYDLTELGVSYRASNGETGYHKIGESKLTERRTPQRGFVRMYKGCHIDYAGHTYVCIDGRGANIGQSPTEAGCEGIIDEYVKNNGNKLYLADKVVAEIKDGAAKVYDVSDANTLRKVKEYLKQNNFKAENAKQIMADYGAKNEALTEKKGKVEGEDDNVYQLVYDALFLGNKNFRPHIADEAGQVYDWEQSLIMLPGYNDYDLGIALEKEEDGKYAKAVADKLGLKYEVKPTKSLSDGYKFIATVRIPDDIADRDATEYVTSIGLDMDTIRPKKAKKK